MLNQIYADIIGAYACTCADHEHYCNREGGGVARNIFVCRGGGGSEAFFGNFTMYISEI